MKYFLFLFFVIFFVSCADTANNSKYNTGDLDGNCFTNKTCNNELICIADKCIQDKCKDKVCDVWMQCSQTTGECDQLKDSYCLKEEDCNTEANEICKEDHTCGIKITEVEDCTQSTDCAQNTVNTVCKDGKCVEPEQDLCENTDCTADINSECNSTTGNCECKTDFHLENGSNECLANQKEVNCKKPEIENSEYTIAAVTITWKENSWEKTPECKWNCKAGFYKKEKNDANGVDNANKIKYTCEKCDCAEWQTCQEDGSCTLTEGKCETVGDACLSQTNEHKICDVNHNCVDATNPCEGIDCGGIDKGECKNLNGTAFCDCKDNYFDDGSLNCIDPCEGKTCSGYGDCEATTILNAHCVCDDNYFADQFNCISPCTGHWNCNNDSIIDDDDNQNQTIVTPINRENTSKRGTCTAETPDSPVCDCIEGYEDPNSDLICTAVCSGVNCSGHGTCNIVEGSPSCNCRTGFAKPSNNPLECLDIDECTSNTNNCDSNADCTNTLGSFTCTCNSGYTGDGVTCTPDLACGGNCETWETCSNNTCIASAGRCNDNIDCSDLDCDIQPISPIDPIILSCICNTDTHFCKRSNTNTCNPTCGTGYECINGSCEPIDGCNNSCKNWEECNGHMCEAKLGSCNDDRDCSRQGSCTNKKTSGPIDPNIDPDCSCDTHYHTCESVQN